MELLFLESDVFVFLVGLCICFRVISNLYLRLSTESEEHVSCVYGQKLLSSIQTVTQAYCTS